MADPGYIELVPRETPRPTRATPPGDDETPYPAQGFCAQTGVIQMSKTFSAAAFGSFRTFNTGVRKAFEAEGAAHANANAACLAAIVLAAMTRPGMTATACVDQAYADAGVNVETERRDRLSMARKAVTFMRAKGIVPVFDPNMGEADILTKVEVFASRYTLRGLYDAAREPAKAKADTAKAERDTARERAEADAREAAGVKGPVSWSVSGLNAAVGPVIDAAKRGEADAIATLEAMRAAIAAAIVEGEAVIAAAKEAANDAAPKRQRRRA